MFTTGRGHGEYPSSVDKESCGLPGYPGVASATHPESE